MDDEAVAMMREQIAVLRERVAKTETLIAGMEGEISSMSGKLDTLLSKLDKYEGKLGGVLLAAAAFIAFFKFVVTEGWLLVKTALATNGGS